MTVFIKELLEIKIDSLICQDIDRLARSVPSSSQDNDSTIQTVDITITGVHSVRVTPHVISFRFDNGNQFVAQIAIDDYYKLEVM